MQASTLPSVRAPRRALVIPPLPKSPLDEERVFVTRLVAGETAAWREFNERYAAMLHRAIGRVLGRFGAVSSSDDVREVYAKLSLSLLARDKIKLRSFDPARGARLGSWLVRLAMQATYDHLRRIKRNPVDFRHELGEVTCELPDAYETCWERQRAGLLAGVMSRLSEREREFFRLYFGEGLDADEIASRMKITVSTVYTKRHKLERRLEELLAEQRSMAA